MKIVIDISEEDYKRGIVMASAIRNGTPLNKVLDSIRAEIEERKKNSGGEPSRELAFNVCLQIIDKYKAEGSEE